MTAHTRHRLGRLAIAAGSVGLFAATLVAQSAPPPIPGATGVAEPEGTKNGGTAAVAAAATKTVEGTNKLLRAIGIGGGDGDSKKAVDPLEALPLGSTVIVRHSAVSDAAARQAPADAQKSTEARVIDINRRTGVIILRLTDRTTETLKLVGRPGELGLDGTTAQDTTGTTSVSYIDGTGQRVVLSFRKVTD